MNNKTRRDILRLTAAATAAPFLATQANAATEHTVLIKNFSFEPADLSIAAGDSVVFLNEDGAPHTATDEAGTFDTGRLNRGQAATITFASASSFSYFCAFHPTMKATLTVT